MYVNAAVYQRVHAARPVNTNSLAFLVTGILYLLFACLNKIINPYPVLILFV